MDSGRGFASEDLVGRALRRIVRAIDLHSRSLAARHNVTAPQLVCLLSVAEHEPTTASSIARDVHLSPSTVVGVLDRLEVKGLVARARDRRDRRVVSVALTAPGRDLAANVPSALQDRLAAAMTTLPDADQQTIARSLERVAAMMEVPHLDSVPPFVPDPELSVRT